MLPSRRHTIKLASLLLPAVAILLMSTRSGGSDEQAQPPVAGAPFQLQPGDHISIIGNALADRMQHDGQLETLLYHRFPKHDLSFRNLGFSGDELKTRQRSANFGTPESWLTKTKTDVIFAFFGYNESFAGDKGLPAFRKELATMLTKMAGQKFNGKSAPRIVLFSPVAIENLHDHNLPDGTASNKRLELYTLVMSEVAKANNVAFVDLFHPTQAAYAKNDGPYTINGLHLNEKGNKFIAEYIDEALFGKRPANVDAVQLGKIRDAVLERNLTWFNRYRTLDGYNIYGGRAKLDYNGVTNKVVMDREMEVLDVMTANRDKVIWAAAQGNSAKADDKNAPPFIPVTTNKKGPLPGGKFSFLDGDDAIKKMTVHKGMKVELFASEKEFPELQSPVQMQWDTKGRLWVAVWPSYPHWKPGDPFTDKLLIFEDTKGTGKADKMTVFADNLNCPTGFEFYNGGVLIAQAPDLIFMKDTKGTGKADLRVRMLHGLDSADSHHTANSFALDPGGALYFQEGTFHHTQVESIYGPSVRNKNAGVFRYEPRTQKFEVYVNVGFANPHGHVFDKWGQDIVMDGTNAIPYHGTLYSGQTADPDQRHPQAGKSTAKNPALYDKKTRPCSGVEILSSRHFPDALQGNLMVLNVIGFQGILQYKINDSGSTFLGAEQDYIVKSSDPNFRPSDIKVGPDGAIYFCDWHNPIIGHMQHHLRDPNRDHAHGRIYKITYPSKPLLQPTKIEGESIERLLNVLKEPEDRVRYRARIELGGRDSKQVIAAVQKWIPTLDPKDANYEHHMMEALWVHQYHNVVSEDLLWRMLRSPNSNARAAATHVLCYWRDQVKDPLELLRVQINDSHPRVRLEAVRALSFFHSEAAIGVAVELLTSPTDRGLTFVFNETLNTLEKRLSTGKIDRVNIASTLIKLLEKTSLDDDRKSTLIEAICRNGSAKELKVIWDKAADPKALPVALRKRALYWLNDAASTRRVKPEVSAAAVLKLLKDADANLLPDALWLAAAWKVKEAGTEFQRIAADGKQSQDARFAAMDGLAALNDADTVKALRGFTAKEHPLAIQFHAASALTTVDLAAAADAAAASLALPDQDTDPSPLIQAFLDRKEGTDKLGAALSKQKITADTAKRILRAMFIAGRSDPALANVISKFAGLDAAPTAPTAAEVQQYVADAMAKGDPARGEHIFRRPDLGCVKCHAINRAGGNIGPDLGPIGSTSPLDYIVTSVLDPSAAIKEEYLTKIITTTTGQIITGIVVERNKNVVVLKDATGRIVRLAAADIEQEQTGKSLMPDGITRSLTKPELLDLMRFVGELGKPGGAYPVKTPTTVQRWKVLKTVPKSLYDGVPNRNEVRDNILAANPAAWETTYGLVNGKLPLDELLPRGQPKVIYLQGEVEVTKAGDVELVLETPGAATFWVGEEQFEKQGKATTVALTPGRHRITVRVEVGEGPAPMLLLDLRKPAGSNAAFEVVQMD
ncbi:MAG TPA: PVC-type heme-binding CxxCH protein [Gemmataceae bacterium]|nr:PVC-type heme-binding CxxCH protein [Gemmataceae bacterium]